jgi:hypothetical protein
MKSKQNRSQMSYWQLIFSQSKVNGARYKDDELPVCNWNWPTGTYLQRRRSFHESFTVSCPGHSSFGEHNETADA